MRIAAPTPYQVVQREGYEPSQSHINAPGGARLGHGALPVSISGLSSDKPAIEWRAVDLSGAEARGTPWTPLDVTPGGDGFTGKALAPAGGWYRIELRESSGGPNGTIAAVEPVGVGEVFVIAGQSYADGCNDELLRVQDPQLRVAAYDLTSQTWRVAHDPLPNVNPGGTIWPAMGDALLPFTRVPIGLVNVAAGGTASKEWLPGTPLCERLLRAGKDMCRFRAVLWQQGESDVMAKVPAEEYVANMVAIRSSLAQAWGFGPQWLLAKSTYHPTVYSDPTGEGCIRGAIERLQHMPGFGVGPDTDVLGEANRGGMETARHFSGIGQRRAGMLWFVAVWNEMNRA